MTGMVDLSGPQLALMSEAQESPDPASYLRAALDWSWRDRLAVAEFLGVHCPGCVGRGTGRVCCMCGLPVPAELRREPGDPGELPGIVADGWPFPIVAGAGAR